MSVLQERGAGALEPTRDTSSPATQSSNHPSGPCRPRAQVPLAGSPGHAPPTMSLGEMWAPGKGYISLPNMGPGTEWRFSEPTLMFPAIPAPTTAQLACLRPLLKPESNPRLGVLTSF